MKIPIRNIWLLQLYASSLYRSAGSRLAGAEDNPDDLADLVATILADEVDYRLHAGLTIGFRDTTRNVTRVRGRINLLTTERHQLLRRGQVNCTFDEVVNDVPVNRLARAALERASRLVPGKHRFRSLALQLEGAGVVGPCPSLSMIPTMQRQRLLARDKLMIAASELLLTMTIPTTDDGERLLPAPDLDEGYLRRLFEHAVFGFYRHRLTSAGWTVSHGQWLNWQASDQSEGMRALLPSMQLDITLQAPTVSGVPTRRIVLDTKFTSITKPGYYREASLQSGYVYQIYAYLMSQEGLTPGVQTEGLMLHPSVGEHVDEEVAIQGHRIRFATIDLMAGPGQLATELLGVIAPRRIDVPSADSTRTARV